MSCVAYPVQICHYMIILQKFIKNLPGTVTERDSKYLFLTYTYNGIEPRQEELMLIGV